MTVSSLLLLERRRRRLARKGDFDRAELYVLAAAIERLSPSEPSSESLRDLGGLPLKGERLTWGREPGQISNFQFPIVNWALVLGYCL